MIFRSGDLVKVGHSNANDAIVVRPMSWLAGPNDPGYHNDVHWMHPAGTLAIFLWIETRGSPIILTPAGIGRVYLDDLEAL